METTFRFKCVKCGACCEDKTTIVNLTFHDIIRLKDGLNLNLNELLEITSFYVVKGSLSSEIFHKMVVPPILTEKGKSFIALRKKDDGSCLFFNNKTCNCRIYALRPCFCRTFPFSYELDMKSELKMLITKKGKQYCLGLKKSSPQINLNYWKPLGFKAIKILEENAKFVEEWNKEQKQPSAKKYLKRVRSISKKSK